MPDEPFSTRHGYVQPKPIAYWNDLPVSVRLPILAILKTYLSVRTITDILKDILDPYGQDESLNSAFINDHLFLSLDWFRIYDLVERAYAGLLFHDENFVYPVLDEHHMPTGEMEEEYRAHPFRDAMNEYFVHAGIGWQIDDAGKVVMRGDENFTEALDAATTTLNATQRPTAAEHLQFARQALSERPKLNTSGAVSHATNAVEALLYDITGRPRGKMTLGDYLKEFPDLFRPTIKEALNKIYGYASAEGARHGKEGTQPTPEEARFVVTTCSAICTLLADANPKK